jgi:hypothetical protein
MLRSPTHTMRRQFPKKDHIVIEQLPFFLKFEQYTCHKESARKIFPRDPLEMKDNVQVILISRF